MFSKHFWQKMAHTVRDERKAGMRTLFSHFNGLDISLKPAAIQGVVVLQIPLQLTASTRSLTPCRQQRHQHVADGRRNTLQATITLYHAVANIPLQWAIGLAVGENGGP